MLPADDGFKVLNLQAEGQVNAYHNLLSDYHRLLSARSLRKDFRGLSSEDLSIYLESVRSKLIDSIGQVPWSRDDASFKSTGEVFFDDYKIEKGYIESAPGRFISAHIYKPLELPKEPLPAILCVHGHAGDGKMQLQFQARCKELVRKGFLVMGIDTCGKGERNIAGHSNKIIFASGVSHQALLHYDNQCAIDHLCHLPEVDTKRIGMTGSSGGGTQTMFTAALDDRITASVVTASLNSYDDHMKHSSSDFCFCEVLSATNKFSDQSDIMALIAPRPCLVLHGTHDRTFPVKGMRESYLRTKDAYEVFGAKEKIQKWESYAPHAYSENMRKAMCDFFSLHLNSEPMGVYRAEGLWADSPKKKELKSFDAFAIDNTQNLDSLTHRFMHEALEIENHPSQLLKTKGLQAYRDYMKENCASIFGLGVEEDSPRLLAQDGIQKYNLVGEGFVVESECGVLVPGVIVGLENLDKARPLAVVLAQAGKDIIVADRKCKALLESGYNVMSIDCRGTGETCYSYYLEEETAFLNSIQIGESLLGGRNRDLKHALNFVETMGYAKPGLLWITDSFSLYSIMPDGLSSYFSNIILDETILSLCDENGFSENGIEHLFVPSILRNADIPQFIGMQAPANICIANPVDGKGRPLASDKIDAALTWAMEANKGNIEVVLEDSSEAYLNIIQKTLV